ncbi:MAG TPA: PLD nuclease N-terminal domain-containing protein [Dictyobacter sp.]|nr:PLD nuclease N-terminal domain-containing protein [Dictyobacter sp.]
MPTSRGCATNTILFLVIVFLPVIGHIIETVFILEDDHSPLGKVIWLLIIWLIPFLGPLLYLLFGQRPVNRGRVMFGQPAYYQPTGYQQ